MAGSAGDFIIMMALFRLRVLVIKKVVGSTRIYSDLLRFSRMVSVGANPGEAAVEGIDCRERSGWVGIGDLSGSSG